MRTHNPIISNPPEQYPAQNFEARNSRKKGMDK